MTQRIHPLSEDQAFECYLNGDYIGIFEDELCSHYEGTTLREEHQDSLSRCDLDELLGTPRCNTCDGR